MTEIHYAEKYNNMQDQTQYLIVFCGFVDSFQKVSYKKFIMKLWLQKFHQLPKNTIGYFV